MNKVISVKKLKRQFGPEQKNMYPNIKIFQIEKVLDHWNREAIVFLDLC